MIFLRYGQTTLTLSLLLNASSPPPANAFCMFVVQTKPCAGDVVLCTKLHHLSYLFSLPRGLGVKNSLVAEPAVAEAMARETGGDD